MTGWFYRHQAATDAVLYLDLLLITVGAGALANGFPGTGLLLLAAAYALWRPIRPAVLYPTSLPPTRGR